MFSVKKSRRRRKPVKSRKRRRKMNPDDGFIGQATRHGAAGASGFAAALASAKASRFYQEKQAWTFERRQTTGKKLNIGAAVISSLVTAYLMQRSFQAGWSSSFGSALYFALRYGAGAGNILIVGYNKVYYGGEQYDVPKVAIVGVDEYQLASEAERVKLDALMKIVREIKEKGLPIKFEFFVTEDMLSETEWALRMVEAQIKKEGGVTIWKTIDPPDFGVNPWLRGALV